MIVDRGLDFGHNGLSGLANLFKGIGYITPDSCIDPASGMPYFNSACVDNNERIRLLNQAEANVGNRSIFISNCKQMIADNNAQRAANRMPLLVDDCDARTYGQTLPGTTGSAAEIPQAAPYYPKPVSPVVIAPTPAIAPLPSSTVSNPYVKVTDNVNGSFDFTSALLSDLNIKILGIPIWLLGTGALGLVFFSGGRN